MKELLTLIGIALVFISPALYFAGRLLWDMEKERRGYLHIAKVMRRQRDDCRAAGEPWTAGRAWPRKDFK